MCLCGSAMSKSSSFPLCYSRTFVFKTNKHGSTNFFQNLQHIGATQKRLHYMTNAMFNHFIIHVSVKNFIDSSTLNEHNYITFKKNLNRYLNVSVVYVLFIWFYGYSWLKRNRCLHIIIFFC